MDNGDVAGILNLRDANNFDNLDEQFWVSMRQFGADLTYNLKTMWRWRQFETKFSYDSEDENPYDGDVRYDGDVAVAVNSKLSKPCMI